MSTDTCERIEHLGHKKQNKNNSRSFVIFSPQTSGGNHEKNW